MREKIILLFLAVALLIFAGCGESSTGNGEKMVVNTVNPSDFIIVRSAESSETVTKAASSLCTAFAKKADAMVIVAQDSAAEKTREIIIGNTTRNVEGLEDIELGFGEYYINMIENKIVILGGSDRAVAGGVQFMIDNLIVENTLKAPTKGGYRGDCNELYNSIKIEGTSISEYTVVYDLYDPKVAENLAEKLSEVGCTLPVEPIDNFDLSSGKYILLQDTNTDFSSHSVSIKNGNITFYANYATIADCVDYFFTDMLNYDTQNSKITGSRDVNITSEMAQTFTVENTPVYTKEKLMEVLGEVYEDDDRLIIAQQAYGGNGMTVETERKRYLENCGVEVPMIGMDLVATHEANENERVKDAYDFIQFMREGGIVTFSIHLTNPIEPEYAYRGTPFTPENWADLFTEGTEINSFLMAELSEIADYLEIFHKNDAPVIFRPLHEMNGNWFWFCITNPDTGYTIPKEMAVDFWKLIYDYIVVERGIDSMIWEYSPNVNSSAANVMYYYPGDEYCDIVSCDWYTGNYTGHDMLTIASNALSATGKIFSVSEFGPNADIYTDLAESPEYKFNCSHLDALITEAREDGIKVAYWLLWSSYAEVKISMWNMGDAKLFYENDVYLTLEDTYELLYE